MHKVTSKRQVTLPQSVCKAMSLKPGDFVEVFERDGVAHIVKMSNENLAGKFNFLIKDQEFPSSQEMKNSINKHAAKKYTSNDCD